MPDPEMTSMEHESCDEALKRIGDCARRRVTVLDLSGLGLTHLPPKIVQLAKLTELDLSHNQLAGLPPEIGQLANLLRLDLSHNPLAALPPEIGQLAKLQSLDISHNPLTSLPPEIGHLASLSRLDGSHNLLAGLPPEIGQLARLTRLMLPHNRLAVLPPEIGHLAGLTRLYLAHNRLAGLPPEIGQLASLTRLDLSHNLLAGLPAEIGRLAKLTVLELSNNQVAALPAEVGQLAKLTVLGLAGNRLSGLPETLGELAGLESLFLHDNPGLLLSPAVLGADPRKTMPGQTPRYASAKSILEFYFARQSGKTRPLNEARLILLGRSGAGKTSVAQALRDLPFHEREDSTPGIALGGMTLDGVGEAAVTVHLWDFSGQEISHALHPLFFSERCVYMVVLAGHGHREREDADYWLRLIREFGSDAQGQGPPVIVAMNQWNVPAGRPEVDRGALRDQYPFIRGFVEMDCKTRKGIPVLNAALCRELERMPWVHEPFPEEWDAVRRTLAAGGMRWTHLSYDAYRELCVEHGVSDEGQQDYLADFLHHLGIALNFRNDPRLRDDTLLRPDWLTKHAYALRHRAQLQAGVLTRADLEMTLYPESDEAARACLLRVLEGFGLVRELRSEAGGGWLFPAALPDAPQSPPEAFRDAEHAEQQRYIYQELPDGLVARIIARRYDFVEEARARKQQWRDAVVLLRKGARAWIRTDPRHRQLLVTVIGSNKPRRQFAALCQAEMRDIHAAIPGPEPAAEILIDGAWVPAPLPPPATPEAAPEATH
jgi:internalin A